jgi:hypothetical protein
MSRNSRQGNGDLPFPFVNVRATDADGVYFEENMVCGNGRNIHLDQLQLANFTDSESLHGVILS